MLRDAVGRSRRAGACCASAPTAATFLQAVHEVDAALAALPAHDAPPRIVERVLAALRPDAGATRSPVNAAAHRAPRAAAARRALDVPERSRRPCDAWHIPAPIDADGHILEAPDLWETLPGAALSRPRPAPAHRRARPGVSRDRRRARRRWCAAACSACWAAWGATSPTCCRRPSTPTSAARRSARWTRASASQRLDQEGLDAAFLYPTLGVLWEAECTDAEIAQAYTRAYNRWIVDFCADSGGRLHSDRASVARRSATPPRASSSAPCATACRGGWVAPFTMTKKPHGHPDHDRALRRRAGSRRAAGHPSDLRAEVGRRPDASRICAAPTSSSNVTAADAVRHAFTTLFQFGVFDRFPRLKLVAARVGRRLDRLLARSHGRLRRLAARPRRAAAGEAEHLLPPPVLDLLRSRTSARSRR